jgi:predicted ester cyclase
MNDQEKRAQIERIYDVFNRRAYDELEEIFHPDYVDHSPTGEIHGAAAFSEHLQQMIAAFPDARFEVSNIIVEGDHAAWQGRLTGTNTGSLMGMPPTGREIDVQSVHMGRLSEDERPLEHWTGNDMLILLRQLGVIPEPQPAPAG